MFLLQSSLLVLEWALFPCVLSSRAGCNLQNGYAKVVLPLTTGIMYHAYCMGTCGTVANVSLTVHPFNESNDVTKDLLIVEKMILFTLGHLSHPLNFAMTRSFSMRSSHFSPSIPSTAHIQIYLIAHVFRQSVSDINDSITRFRLLFLDGSILRP